MRNGSETQPPSGHHQPAAGTDIGQLFRELRRCLALPLPELARRLESRIDVIQALESGDVTRLPPWPETVRVVSAYTLLAGIDPRPVLHIIGEKITARSQSRGASGKREVAAEHPPAAIGVSLPARVSHLMAVPGSASWLPRGGKVMGALIAAAAAMALVIGTGMSASHQAAATGNPGLFASLGEYFLQRDVTVRDGLKWIEVEDPRSRRADKLRPGRQ